MLHQSTVYKCLEKKTLILGFEIADLFLLCVLLCLLNIFFASSELKIFWTWGPVSLAALLLRLTKHGKAENFLIHWIRYHLQPGVLRAFPRAGENHFLTLNQRRSSNVLERLS